jgi:hypothetical protein
LHGIKTALDHYLKSYDEKENELANHKPSDEDATFADSKQSVPVESIELGDLVGAQLSVSEELEVRANL